MTYRTDDQSSGERLDLDIFADERTSPAIRAGVRRRGRSALRFLAMAAAWAFVAVSIGIGAFFLALARGPISFDWLAPAIAESLGELYGRRYDFDLGAAVIANTDHGPTLTLDGLTIKAGGRTILAAPRAELSVDPGSLLYGRVRPRRLEVFDLELRLAVMSDGVIAVSAGTDPPIAIPLDRLGASDAAAPQPQADGGGEGAVSLGRPAAPPAPVPRAALLKQATIALHRLVDLATSPDSPIGAIDRIGVAHGRLVIEDRTVDRTISYDDLSLSFDKSVGAMNFSLAATGASRRWSATATARGAPGGRRTFDVQLRDLSLDEIALVGGFRNLKFDTDAPLSLNLHFALAGDDRVLEASGRFGAKPGFFRLEDPDCEPVMIDDIFGVVRWDSDSRRFLVDPVEVDTSGSHFVFKGSATPPRATAGLDADADAGSWTIAAELARPGVFAPLRPGEKNVVVEQGRLSAKFTQADDKVTVDRFEMAGPDLKLTASGSMDWADGPHLKYGLAISETPAPVFKRLWPSTIAVAARAWFLEHVPAGMVRTGTMAADLDDAGLTAMRYGRPPPDAAIGADFDIVDATIVSLLPGLPPFTGVSGRVHVAGHNFGFAASAGTIETAPAHRLVLSEGSFVVPETGLNPVPAVLEMRLAGNVEAAADILTVESVAPYATLPVEGGVLKGQIEGRLRVDLELGASARNERTIVAIDADASNLSVERFIGKEKLENAALKVVADRGGLRVTGVGRLYGAPATVDIRRPYSEKQAQAQVSVVFDEAARAKAGFGLPGVAGPINALIKMPVPTEEADAQIELDLTKAVFDNPIPGLTKPAGQPGKTTFTLVKRAEGLALEQFALDGGGAQANGVVELTRDGAFRSAKLSQMRLSPGDDARVEATRNGDALKLVVRCSNFDARPILRSLMQSGPVQPSADRPAGRGAKPSLSFDDFDLDFKSPIVTGHGKQILANVDLKLERRGGKPRAFSLSGNFGREPVAAALMRVQNSAPQIEISTSDGGSLLSFLDLYSRMEGGALNASVALGQGGAAGVLRIHDFYLKNEPAMRQLMTQGAARADDRGVVRFDPNSVTFSRLQAGFGWSGGRLGLRDAVMSGPEIGLTADGFVDFESDRMDVSGAYVPAYALNNLVSNIPLLGLVLAGGQHEGVFALNYRIAGTVSAPLLNVNPLSAIAPGVVRKVMGVVDGTARLPEPSAGAP